MEIIKKGNYSVIIIDKDVEFSFISEFENFMKTNTKSGDVYALDLSFVNYIDSSGIGALINSIKYVRNLKSDIYIFNISEDIERIFKLVYFEKFVKLFKTEDEFYNFFNNGNSEKVVEENKDMVKTKEDKEVKNIITPIEHTLIIESEYIYVEVVILFIKKVVRKYFDISEDELVELEIAIAEAATNSIEHGYKDANIHGKVRIWTMIIENIFFIGIEDYGQGFNPEVVKEKIANAAKDPFSLRGRGINIINKVMDEVIYKSNEKSNSSVFYLVKNYDRIENEVE